MLTMLEHQKIVILNISKNKQLFSKELLKSMRWLDAYELFELEQWAICNFGESHQKEISEVFCQIPV